MCDQRKKTNTVNIKYQIILYLLENSYTWLSLRCGLIFLPKLRSRQTNLPKPITNAAVADIKTYIVFNSSSFTFEATTEDALVFSIGPSVLSIQMGRASAHVFADIYSNIICQMILFLLLLTYIKVVGMARREQNILIYEVHYRYVCDKEHLHVRSIARGWNRLFQARAM